MLAYQVKTIAQGQTSTIEENKRPSFAKQMRLLGNRFGHGKSGEIMFVSGENLFSVKTRNFLILMARIESFKFSLNEGFT